MHLQATLLWVLLRQLAHLLKDMFKKKKKKREIFRCTNWCYSCVIAVSV